LFFKDGIGQLCGAGSAKKRKYEGKRMVHEGGKKHNWGGEELIKNEDPSLHKTWAKFQTDEGKRSAVGQGEVFIQADHQPRKFRVHPEDATSQS